MRDDIESRLRAAIEATRLNFGLTEGDVKDLARSAVGMRLAGICVPARFLPAARAAASGTEADTVDFVTVANFPTGDHLLESVLLEAETAARTGADHIDLVVPGDLLAGREWPNVRKFIQTVREHAEVAARERAGGRAERPANGDWPDADGRAGEREDDGTRVPAPAPVALKVILETAAFDEQRIQGAAESAIEAGARWLKTSTGFHPAGGATVEVVALLRRLAPSEVGIKASGGIRTREAALAMLEAGADRIGTSSERAIVG